MHTYTLPPEGLAAIRRRGIRQSVLLYGGIGAFVLVLTNRGDFSSTGLTALAVAGSVTALLITLVIWSSVRALPKEWSSYALVVGDDMLIRQHHRLGETTIRRDEVTQIEEYPETGLLLKTADPKTTIFVPIGLDGYATVQALLVMWMPLTPKVGLQGVVARCVAAFAVPAVLFAGVLVFDDVAVVAVTSAIFVGGWIWALDQLRRHGRLRGWSLVFMLLASVLLLFMLITRLARVMAM